MKRPALAALLALAAVVAALFWQAREPAVEGPGGFDLFAFFEGSSVSEGTVETLAVRREPFTARFLGAREGERFRLEERFAFARGDPRQVWRLYAVPGGYAGTVETERANGTLAAPVPVTGTADAGAIVLTYRGIAPGGGTAFDFRHRMAMRADGTVENVVTVRKFGLPVARSDVIFAKDPAALSSAALSSAPAER